MKHPHGHNPASRHIGEYNPNAKLCLEKVTQMRQMRRELGMSISHIAGAFCVSVGTASKAISGKTWRHV